MPEPASQEEELKAMEAKLNQLKRDYEHYFMGNRPAAPSQQRGELQKSFLRFTNTPIQNTAIRFKYNTLNQRFLTFKRQWDTILRQIDAGTYKRHLFKADLHDKERAQSAKRTRGAGSAAGQGAGKNDLFETYRDAALACGQSVKGLTPEKLQAVVRQQEAALKKKLGCERVNFRVVVESGKVKLKASAAS